jgi:hypothetical protein
MAGGTTNSETDIFMAHLRIAQQQHLDYHQRARCPRGGRGAPTFCHDCRPNIPTKERGCGMGSVDVLRNKAEEYLEKARAISDRQRARLLLLQAHNYLKCAEETEAQQLSARR